MTVTEVANELVDLCRKGQHREALERLYANDIVSIEPMGENPKSTGIDAVRAKTEWFFANHEIHGGEVSVPFVNGDQFIVDMKSEVTNKQTNERQTMHEMALYTVRDGKIVAESFFFPGH